ncbi:hypothetical protein Q5P01_005143 [Channa striata]|uniref:Ig-like domain-containing protein n=1 Tax=Channa striata TaxID=64152 RepID=A0AA88NC07_CHASR|nr:hypothetical protein Q5P01_005143 [Channa striata]
MAGNNHVERTVLSLLLISFISTASSVTSELNSVPVKTVSLQCVSLTYVEQGRCSPQQQQWVSLTWVDEVGTVIETDAEHQIQQESSCDITLTVPLHTTRKKTFRCQATVAEHVETSLNITVGASGIEHKGRRFIIEPAPQGGSQDGMIGGAVGVVGCAVLAAVVVVLVLHKRRTNIQMPDGQCSVQSNTNNVMNTDDVIYVNVILPAGSESVCVHECESTEYACVRY